MKISRDPASRLWTLTSGDHVLYAGRRSPWDNPRVMREALERERCMSSSTRTLRASGALHHA